MILLCAITGALRGQALQDINYNYMYSPAQQFSFQIKPIREEENWKVLYQLRLNSSEDKLDHYEIQWEQRETLSSKEGLALDSLSVIIRHEGSNYLNGEVAVDKKNKPQIIAAKVIDTANKRAWFFYEFLLPEYPINNYLENENHEVVFESFASQGEKYSISGNGSWIMSRYLTEFPAAAPAFSEGLARVPSVIREDSVFTISSEQLVSYDEEGLYLVQRDTSSKEGFAFNVYDDYPKFAHLENLADPLIYVCTRQEIEKLKAARGDKKSFDRVILGITGNADRAKNFMRNYFGRVELANQYFSSYKEGWKTDRGMIFIIFGLPDELYRFSDREVWEYKNDLYKATFDFVRSPTLFDPDNYVLVRKKKFQDTWYQVIDLWRNARF